MAYKSKCKEVACCCIRIIRDTEKEFRLARKDTIKPIEIGTCVPLLLR